MKLNSELVENILRLKSVHANMLNRCNNTNHPNYHRYGGRGITVCDEWLNSYINFIIDMIDGYKQGLSIDRIDNNGNYTKDNCRWTTQKEQMRNTERHKESIEKYFLSVTDDDRIEYLDSLVALQVNITGKEQKDKFFNSLNYTKYDDKQRRYDRIVKLDKIIDKIHKLGFDVKEHRKRTLKITKL